ncbi:MAG: hypothetical protein ABI790_06515 [Betaproteobacteria bacterium]
MNQQNRRSRRCTAMLAAALLVAGSVAHATDMSDAQSLARGATVDVTPQQKYRSAIREAGGAHKEAMRECAQSAGDDRLACLRAARATYEFDMAEARQILRSWGGMGPMGSTGSMGSAGSAGPR